MTEDDVDCDSDNPYPRPEDVAWDGAEASEFERLGYTVSRGNAVRIALRTPGNGSNPLSRLNDLADAGRVG